jgi:RNA polymerase-binding transcription factor DksA
MSLTPTQLRHLERRLLDERALATETLGRTLTEWSVGFEQERAGDLTSMPFHPADRATDTMGVEIEATNAARVSRELAEIDAALSRLYEAPEQFGRCAESGADVPFERLDVIPWARTCAQAERGRR